MKLNNKIAIGCLVQWYEIEMIEEYIQSLVNAMELVQNRENVTIDICMNLNEGLEKLDTSKITMHEIEKRFLKMVRNKLGNCNYVYYTNETDIYSIADYRRDFNNNYCTKVDVLMWGESDS